MARLERLVGGGGLPAERAGAFKRRLMREGIGLILQGIGSLLLSLLILQLFISFSFSQTEFTNSYSSAPSASGVSNSSSELRTSEGSALGTGISDEFFLDRSSPLFGEAEPIAAESPLGEGFGWLAAKVVLFLFLLAGMAYGIHRFSGRRALRAPGRQGLIRVLGLEPIGMNRFLQIVDIAGRIVVLGITEQNIQFLTEITDMEAIKTLKADHSVASAEDGEAFSGHLREWLSRVGVKEEPAVSGLLPSRTVEDRAKNFLREERSRLRRMAL